MEIIQVEEADLQEIEGNRCRTFRAVSQPLTAEVIFNDIRKHQRQRVIVICNTVSQSQGLFRDLEELNVERQLRVTLLHSRFLPKDRADKETQLKETFAQNWQDDADGSCQVLISTQVIEAGINITCEVMHTHLCPMNALLQRAGRCARFPGEQGEVYVYESVEVNPNHFKLAEIDLEAEGEETSKKKRKFLPYSEQICELTWQVLQEHTASERVHQNVGFRLEEAWINRVHQAEDQLNAQRRQNNQMNFEERFNSAVFRGDRSAASELIRLVDNRSVFIWEESNFIFDVSQDVPVNPKNLVAFSLPITTLCKVFREAMKLESGSQEIFKRIESPKQTETYDQPVCVPIRSLSQLKESIRILVNPRYVHYDADVGLLIGVDVFGNQFVSPPKQPKPKTSEYEYHMDTYVGHLGCMWTCWRKAFSAEEMKNGQPTQVIYASVRDELLPAGGRLIKTRIFPDSADADTEALFESLVFFAILIHDLGKLQLKWQEVMRGWQHIAYRDHGGKNPHSYLLAHTDSDPKNASQQQALRDYEKKHRRPPHAIESAFMGREILKQSLVPLLQERFGADTQQCGYIAQTVVLAAGRHHSAWAQGDSLPGKIELHPQSQAVIAKSWESMARFLPKTLPLQKANLKKQVYSTRSLQLGDVFTPAQTEYLHLYLMVVRALRLCDTRAVQL